MVLNFIFTNIEVFTAIAALKTLFWPGPVGIPHGILRFGANIFRIASTLLFNSCLTRGCFAKLWKEFYLIHIHENDAKNKIQSYKLFEHLLANFDRTSL